jgi:hypothetical protein
MERYGSAAVLNGRGNEVAVVLEFNDALIAFPILNSNFFISVSCMSTGVRQLNGIVLAILFYREGKVTK